jgi:imidazolonepropionase-like amidohydrolase
MHLFRHKLLVWGFLILGAGTTACAAQVNTNSALVFRHARVFDGARLLPGETDVAIEKGVIARLEPGVHVPAGAKEIDAKGKTLLPGLIDAHTHLVSIDVLRAAPIFGVTTELDMFCSTEDLAEARKLLATQKGAQMADLRSAGTLVTSPGGHGTEYGVDVPTLSESGDAQAFVDARIAEGSDYIKIVYDDGKAFRLSMPTLSKETMRAVITAAHNCKKLAVVHIGSLQGARDAIETGADGLAHLFIDRAPDPDFGRFVAEHHGFVVPTLAVLQSALGQGAGAKLVKDEALAPYLSPEDEGQLKKSFPARVGAQTNFGYAEAAVGQLKAAGAPILAGTDAPNPGTTHGASLHQELELLVQAGLTPAEALAAATSVPAERFKLADRGRIAVGQRADLLLVDGDPTTDIRATRKIAGVWKQGIEIDRDAWRARVEKERTEARVAASSLPKAIQDGLVSDFEDGKPSARFGLAWQTSTDALRGGKSTASIKNTEGGPGKSKSCLLVEGNVAEGMPFAWAGAIFYPGRAMMDPVDLSSKKGISFWSKGDGRTYTVMLFAQSRGFMPASQTFVAGPEWKQVTFKVADFDGLDGHDLMGLFIGAGLPAGKFQFQMDNVRFE